MLILVLESSTTSAKAMIYNTETAKYETKTKPYRQMYEDITTQNAEEVFLTTAKIGKELADGKHIDMIALSGTWHSVMLCDKQENPVTPVYLWSYTGVGSLCAEIREDTERVNQYYQKTGCMVNAIYPMFKLMRLKQEYNLRDYTIMGQGTYSTYKLTGMRVITECMASGTGLLNIRTKRWESSLLECLGIGEEELPTLVPYDSTYPLHKEGAQLLGLKEGIPVIPANSDGGLNQIGVGALAEGVMTFSIGTSGALRLSASEAVIPETPATWCYLSPKAWLVGAATSGCCNCIDWFRERVGTQFSYEELETGVGSLENTPVFLPFLFGERCPGWNDEKSGGFMAVEPHHDIKDMYRAIQEGVLFNLYQCYRLMVELNGNPKRIKLSGGILHSKVWQQMCVDIFQMEMEIDEMPQGSLLGGVALAMELLGLIPDASDFIEQKTQIIKPNLDNASLYEEKFERYLKYYHVDV